MYVATLIKNINEKEYNFQFSNCKKQKDQLN